MKILLIEDQAMVRSMLTRVCREHAECESVVEAAGGEEGIALCAVHRFEVILLDLELPDGDGLELIDRLLRLAPGARIIIVTSHCDEYTIHRSLQMGVAAFVDKCSEAFSAVPDAIDAVLRGRTYYSPMVARVRARLREDPKAFTKLLSEREQGVLRLLGGGLANDVVAERLGISPGTVHAYRRNIMFKLGIHSTPELIRYAVEKGFTRLGTGLERVGAA